MNKRHDYTPGQIDVCRKIARSLNSRIRRLERVRLAYAADGAKATAAAYDRALDELNLAKDNILDRIARLKKNHP